MAYILGRRIFSVLIIFTLFRNSKTNSQYNLFPGNRTDLPTFPVTDLFPYYISSFYRYCGSLTTPPCTESVIWTIFPDIVYISQYQVNIEKTK
jgi:carbonic anhydrase